MPVALHERVGLVSATIAFVAAALWPFRQLLLGDLAGPLGAIPPLTLEVAGVVIAPILAAAYGYHVGAAVTDRSLRSVASRVGVGALAGVTVGALAGWVSSRVLVFRGTGGLRREFTTHAAVSLLVEPLLILPLVVAVTVGVVGGVVARAMVSESPRDDVHSSTEWGGRPEKGSRTRLLALAGLFGFLGGFATAMGKFGVWFASAWVVLGGVQYALLASVGVPLAMVGAAALVASPPTTRRHLRLLVGATVAGTVGGGVAAYAYSFAAEGQRVNILLSSVFGSVVVDAASVVGVVALSALVGSAYQGNNSAKSS